jgi:hypothetical protein
MVTCLLTTLIALGCAGLACAAALVPAPAPVLPFVVATSIVLPMLAAWSSSSSLAVLRHRWLRGRLDERALAELRRDLEALPEIGHPLDR